MPISTYQDIRLTLSVMTRTANVCWQPPSEVGICIIWTLHLGVFRRNNVITTYANCLLCTELAYSWWENFCSWGLVYPGTWSPDLLWFWWKMTRKFCVLHSQPFFWEWNLSFISTKTDAISRATIMLKTNIWMLISLTFWG